MKNFTDLMAVVANGKRDEMHASFGTHFTKGANPEILSQVANKMIARCNEWVANWKTVQNGIEPELQKLRQDNLESTASKFVGYTDEQLEALVERIKAKRDTAA